MLDWLFQIRNIDGVTTTMASIIVLQIIALVRAALNNRKLKNNSK